MPNLRRSIAVLASLTVLSSSILIGTAEAKSPKKTNLTIFGAASLTKVLPELSQAFRQKNKSVSFTFSFAGSSTLAQQIISGANADLFFAAGPAPMDILASARLLDGKPANFTSNSLVMVVPNGNPAKLATLSDLAKPGVKFLICAPQVPCGSASAKILNLANITAQPASLESDVKSVLTKVALGEADAGLVYRTDVTSQVTAIEIPESASAINHYPAAVIKGSKSLTVGRAFLKFVLSKPGQAILTKSGFGRP